MTFDGDVTSVGPVVYGVRLIVLTVVAASDTLAVVVIVVVVGREMSVVSLEGGLVV